MPGAWNPEAAICITDTARCLFHSVRLCVKILNSAPSLYVYTLGAEIGGCPRLRGLPCCTGGAGPVPAGQETE